MARAVSVAIAQYNWEILAKAGKQKKINKIVFLPFENLSAPLPGMLGCRACPDSRNESLLAGLRAKVCNNKEPFKNDRGKLADEHTRVAVRPRRVSGSGGQVIA